MFKKVLTGLFAFLYLTSNVALVHSAESNIWAERRRATQQSNSPTQLAGVPASYSGGVLDPNELLQKLPEIKAIEPHVTSQLKKLNPHMPGSVSSILKDVPLNMGTIRDVFIGPRSEEKPIVLLLQDVHMNMEAQKNLSGILVQMSDKYPSLLVGVEGAFGSFDFTWYRSFKNKELIKAVADCFLKMNKIAAPSYAGLTASQAWTKFVGIDDEKEYQANVNAYRSSVNLKPNILNQLKKAHQELSQKKRTTLNSRLLKLDQKIADFHSGRMGFGSYVLSLSQSWDAWAGKDKEKFSEGTELEMEKFLAAYKLEKSLDFRRVEKERSEVVKQLALKVDKSDIQHLVADSVAFQAGKITFGDYYRDIQAMIQKKGVYLDNAPAFQDYIRYVLLSDGVKVDLLMDAVSRMEKRLLDGLAKTPAEKELVKMSTYLYLTSRLIDFALTPDEWEEYKKLTPPTGRRGGEFPPHVLKWGGQEGSSLKPFEQFYISADKRSDQMIKNLLKAFGSQNSNSKNRPMILLAGGFHTPQLAQLLKDKEMSYAVIQPKITKITDESGTEYLSIFTREKTPLDKLFEGEKLFLAIAGQALGSNPQGAAKAVTNESQLLLGAVANSFGEDIPAGSSFQFQQTKSGDVSVTAENNNYSVRVTKGASTSESNIPGQYELAGIGRVDVRPAKSIREYLDVNPAVWFGLAETIIPTLISYFSKSDTQLLFLSAIGFWFLHGIARIMFVQVIKGQSLNHRDVMKFFTGLVGSLLIFFPFFNERPLDAAAALSAFIHVVWNGVLAPMFPNLVPLLMVKSEMEEYEKTFRETRMGKLVIRDTKYYDFAWYYLSGNPGLANSPELVKLFKLLLNQERIISKKRNRKDFPSQNHLIEFLLKTLVKSKDQSRWINFINENHENLARLNSGILEELGENYTSRGVFLFESDLDYFVKITNKDAAEMVISFIKNFDEENDGPHPLRAYIKTDQGLRNLNQLTKKKADHIAYIGDQDGDAYKDFSVFLVESKAKFEDIEYLPRELWEYFTGGVDYFRYIEDTYGPNVLLCLIQNFRKAQKDSRVDTVNVQQERNYFQENRNKLDAIYGGDGLNKFIQNPSIEVLEIMALNSLDDIQTSMGIILKWVRQSEINLLFSTEKAGGMADLLRFARERKNVERLNAYIQEMRKLSVPYFDIDIFLYRSLESDEGLEFITLVPPEIVAKRMKDNYALVVAQQNFLLAFHKETAAFQGEMYRFLANVIQFAKDRSVSAQLSNYRTFLVDDYRGGSQFIFEWLGKLFSLANRRVSALREDFDKSEELKYVAKILKLHQEIVSQYRGKEVPAEIKGSLHKIVDPDKTLKQIYEDLIGFRDSLIEKLIGEIIAPAEAEYIKTNFPLIWVRLRQIVIQLTSLGHMNGRGHELRDAVKKVMRREVNNLIPTTRDENNRNLSYESHQLTLLTSISELPSYMERILDKGLEVDVVVQPLTKAQKEIELKTKWTQLTEELIQIFTELDFTPEGKTAENVNKVAFSSLADVVQAMDELRAAFRDSYPPRLQRVQDMQEDFVKLDATLKKNAEAKESFSSQIKQKSVQVIIKKDFLTEASVGMLPFSGCFITGAGHDEMPFIHALEKNGMIATIRDAEGNVLSNAVLVFGKEGVLVFPAYSEIGAYNYDLAWLEAFKTLSNYVPKIVLYPPATSMPASAGFNSAVSENISPVEYANPVTITKPYRYLVEYYTDETSGSDEAKSQEYVKWKFKKATVLKRGQFPDHKLSVLRARQKEKEIQQQRESLKAIFLNSKRDGFSKGLFGLSAQSLELRTANFGSLLGAFESILLRGDFQGLVSALMPRGNGVTVPISEDGKEIVRSYIQKFIDDNKGDVDNFRKQYASIGKVKSRTKKQANPASFLHLVFQAKSYYNGRYEVAFKFLAWASVLLEWQMAVWVKSSLGFSTYMIFLIAFFIVAHYAYEFMYSKNPMGKPTFYLRLTVIAAYTFHPLFGYPDSMSLIIHLFLDLFPIWNYVSPEMEKYNRLLESNTPWKDTEIDNLQDILDRLIPGGILGLDEALSLKNQSIKYLTDQMKDPSENQLDLLTMIEYLRTERSNAEFLNVADMIQRIQEMSTFHTQVYYLESDDTKVLIDQIKQIRAKIRSTEYQDERIQAIFKLKNKDNIPALLEEFSFSRQISFVDSDLDLLEKIQELDRIKGGSTRVQIMVTRQQLLQDEIRASVHRIQSDYPNRVALFLLLGEVLNIAVQISINDLSKMNRIKDRLIRSQA